jgi:hypothetical protein
MFDQLLMMIALLLLQIKNIPEGFNLVNHILDLAFIKAWGESEDDKGFFLHIWDIKTLFGDGQRGS